jgi:DNA-directed RNA polymerase subunit M/transcription elongation factor TFIIS
MEELRKSVIVYVAHIASKLAKQYNLPIRDIKKNSVRFEQELYGTLTEHEYAKISCDLEMYLMTNVGYFPDEIMIIKYINEHVTVKDIIDFDRTMIVNNPRTQIIKMYTMLLYQYYKNKDEILNIAKTIEKSCYNDIIRNSKQSEDPPCRQWDSPVFLEMYSNRCGIIYNLMDPTSNSCKLYGSTLLDKVLSGDIDLREIGNKTEKELCPQATQKERDEIALRSEQHVVEKESNLFKCPNCKERRVTYREVQLRALDEAPDYLCKCLNCNHRFKGR